MLTQSSVLGFQSSIAGINDAKVEMLSFHLPFSLKKSVQPKRGNTLHAAKWQVGKNKDCFDALLFLFKKKKPNLK